MIMLDNFPNLTISSILYTLLLFYCLISCSYSSVRRAAANLCREIYSCAMTEIVILANDKSRTHCNNDASFVSELVECGEEVLFATMKRCISADDVDRLRGSDYNTSSSLVRGKTRLYDPATVARCIEALEVRHTIESLGIFDAISLILRQKANNSKSAIHRFIQKEVGNCSLKLN